MCSSMKKCEVQDFPMSLSNLDLPLRTISDALTQVLYAMPFCSSQTAKQ